MDTDSLPNSILYWILCNYFYTLATSFRLYRSEFPRETDLDLSIKLLLSLGYISCPNPYHIHNQFLNCFIRTECFENLNNLTAEDLIERITYISITDTEQETSFISFTTNSTTTYYTPPTTPEPVTTPVIINNPQEDNQLEELFDLFNHWQSNPTPITTPAIMATEDQVRAIVNAAIYGAGNLQANGTPNIGAIDRITQLRNARGNSKIVEVPEFHGKDSEDPYEWIRLFEQAQRTNAWPNNRRINLAAGFLRNRAMDWYLDNQAALTDWEDRTDANTIAASFKIQFLLHFATEAKRRRWLRELRNIRQQDGESIEEYANRFRKLLRKATNDTPNNIPDIQQVDNFIEGLKPFYVYQVRLNEPATLAAAITRARLVEDTTYASIDPGYVQSRNITNEANKPTLSTPDDFAPNIAQST